MNAWSINVLAARAVALHAASVTEAREFLQMLGIVENGRILPDDTRCYPTDHAFDSADGYDPPINRRDPSATPPAGLRSA